MRNLQDTFETRKRSLISVFSIYMTVPSSFVLEFEFKVNRRFEFFFMLR